MIDWATAVLQFPGQASQQVGMGADLAARYPIAAATFAEADHVLNRPISSICFEGPAEALDETNNTQPALYAMGVAILRVLRELYPQMMPLAVAGHSLGEFTALTAAGALPFDAGLRLVAIRGRLMREEGERRPGSMAALLGVELDDVRAICTQATQDVGVPVTIGNDNCPGQVAISGAIQAVDRALEIARTRGIKKAVKLAVSVAPHSPLMTELSVAFRAALDETPFETPQVPILGNVSAKPLHTVAEIRSELESQLTETVRWSESVQALCAMGARTFLELGPKDVLTGLLRRIDRNAIGVAVNSAGSVSQLADL